MCSARQSDDGRIVSPTRINSQSRTASERSAVRQSTPCGVGATAQRANNVKWENTYSMEVAADPFESAKSHLFDTSCWGPFCDVTLTLKQARQSEKGAWIKIDDYRSRQAFRHFMNLLNRAVYRAAFRRYGKRLRVLPVLEKGEVRASALRPCERGTSGRWHIHCAIELPAHLDAIALERLIRRCWAKIGLSYSRIKEWTTESTHLTCGRRRDSIVHQNNGRRRRPHQPIQRVNLPPAPRSDFAKTKSRNRKATSATRLARAGKRTEDG